jgi:hypothetical protein
LMEIIPKDKGGTNLALLGYVTYCERARNVYLFTYRSNGVSNAEEMDLIGLLSLSEREKAELLLRAYARLKSLKQDTRILKLPDTEQDQLDVEDDRDDYQAPQGKKGPPPSKVLQRFPSMTTLRVNVSSLISIRTYLKCIFSNSKFNSIRNNYCHHTRNHIYRLTNISNIKKKRVAQQANLKREEVRS